MMEEDFSFLKPPPMAPPKPPSICSSGSASSLPISTPPSDTIPEPPKFAPPQLPSEKQHKSYKTPPPKPIRLSSIPNMDSPPQTPAPPPPVQTPTRSTFNPKNTAKLYNIPKPSVLGGVEDRNTKPKHMLVLEDSGSGRSTPVLIEVDGNTPKVATPTKPVSKDVQELKENVHIVRHSPPPMPEPDKDNSAPLEKDKSLQTVHQTPPQLQKPNSAAGSSESSKDKVEGSTSQSGKYSPIIDRKLRNLKSSETSTAREAHVASPLALLMAAKERDKHRSSHVSSQEIRKNEQSSAVFHPSDSSPNSFIVTPRSSLSSSLSSQNTVQENRKPASKQTIPQKSSADTMTESLSPTNLVTQKQTEQSPPKPQATKHKDDKEELIVPLLPPPPEFDDLQETAGLPPSIPPPAPATKKEPTPNVIPDPAPLPKPKLPEAPKLPPPDTKVKPKPQVQAKPKAAPPQQPSTLSPSQATLMGILQRKMLEMDQKMGPVKVAESPSDDWGTPLSDENNKVPVVPRVTPQSKNGPAVNKAATLDMRELKGKMAQKNQEVSSAKCPIR